MVISCTYAFCIFGLLFANTAAITSHPCVMLHHLHHVLIQVTNYEILQHFMSEQIDLHFFKAITAASCVDIIVNKRLNKYN